MAQVSKEHYSFFNYIDEGHWISYYYQIKEVLECQAKNVLYIGKGDGVVCTLLAMLSINVTTFDFDESLNPNIVGDIKNINKYVFDKYDCIVCCEVLEHIEFKYVSDVFEQFRHLCDDTIIISVPDRSFRIKINVSLPKIKIKKLITFNRFIEKEVEFNGEHYWEAGNRNYSKRKILDLASMNFEVVRNYNVIETDAPLHWFLY